MVIEDGEVVVPLIFEDERKKEEEEEVVGDRIIIDKNWILDCECIDENNKNITKDDCYYCKHGSVFIGVK